MSEALLRKRYEIQFSWKNLPVGVSFIRSLVVDRSEDEALTECRAVLEVSGAFLCLFHTQADMNQTLGRASIFSEGTRATWKEAW